MDNKRPDYSFMKSGFNTLKEPEPNDPELVLQVASMVSAFAFNALDLAAKYVEHAKRQIISQTDIKICMKAETFKFLNRNDTVENVNKWRNIIKKDLVKELNGEESESDDEEDLVEDLVEDFKLSECTCEMCTNINNIEQVWENWVPQTPIETALKKTIDTKL